MQLESTGRMPVNGARALGERERERGGVVEASVTEVYEVKIICIEINLFVVGLSYRMACAVCTSQRFPFALLGRSV